MKAGLLGHKLSHSYSPQIHKQLGSYSYALFEVEPDFLHSFLRDGDFSALNVTIPYKQAVIPFCATLSPIAQRLGAVNTIIRQPDGSLLGHNSDYYGFLSSVRRLNLSLSGKKALVIGSGGASRPAAAVLTDLGMETIVISHRDNTPQTLSAHADATLLVNATPVGMYPDVGKSPVNLAMFPRLEGVLDLIYNPARTALLLDAQHRGLVTSNGLWMLVAQAVESAGWFTGTPIDETAIAPIYQNLCNQMENIVLIGMPGCGKSTIGSLLARQLGRPFIDADERIADLAGSSIPDIFASCGESGFRVLETRVLAELGKQSACVIATGGGCVTRDENYPHLHQNGTIIWLERDLSVLPTEGRPLSMSTNLAQMYEQRAPLYRRFADFTLKNHQTPADCVSQILSCLQNRGAI